MIDNIDLDELRNGHQGRLVTPEDADYDEQRSIYNAAIDKRPGVIAKCKHVGDVMACIDFVRSVEIPFAVKGGGHSGPGYGLCEDGLVIDLSDMNGVVVDPAARQARAEGGALTQDLDFATHAFGLAVPTGTISTTGLGGLTLGGGHGYLTRKYGLTIDNLVEADVVLADGSFVKASKEQHKELFWAIRGGGGNFGIVTSFLFDLHPVENVYAGPTFWNLEDAPSVLKWYRDFINHVPNEVYSFFAFLTVPEIDLFPKHLQGKKMCGMLWCGAGDLAQSKKQIDQLLDEFPPAFNGVAEIPYPALQTMHDALYPKGLQWYWKGNYVNELPDEAIDIHMEFADKMPEGHSTMHLYPINGAVHEVGKDETAFAYRDATWSQVMVGVDPDPALFDRLKNWSREYYLATRPYSAEGSYLNFMMEEEDEVVENMFGDNYDRLSEVKGKYDPHNLFRQNQNIEQAVS